MNLAARVGLSGKLFNAATLLHPPEKPQREIVARGVETADGSRGFGIVIPHCYKN